MRIESLRIKNYKAFRDVHLTDIPAMLVVVGANGTGKSTLFDVFSFLRDCLTYDVRKALNMRGGFKEVLSREAEEEVIEVEVSCAFAVEDEQQHLVYRLKIADTHSALPIQQEELRLHRSGFSPILLLTYGEGRVFVGGTPELEKIGAVYSPVKGALGALYEASIFGVVSAETPMLKIVGPLPGFTLGNTLLQFLTSFHLFNFDLNAAIGRKPRIGDPEQLSESGDNLALVARTLYEQHPEIFAKVLERLSRFVPGLAGVEPLVMEDGSLILRFQDGSFQAPFLDRQVSDGTIKLFAYLLLLYDPKPRAFLGIDEPENHLYPQLMAELAEEFRYYTARGGGQVLIATHSPDFLNAVEVQEVCWLVKRQGRTEIRRAKDNQQVAVYMAEGDQMGYLWKQGFFKEVDPR